jgi:hypothetical protein
MSIKNYELNFQYKEKIKNFDKFILSKTNKYINDDLLSVYIIENELLKNECKSCKHDSIWMKKPLPMVLDRINNVITDNRIENLRFLCPNCFSQLKKRKTLFTRMTKDAQRICIDCGKRIKNTTIKQDTIKCKRQRCTQCINKVVMN